MLGMSQQQPAGKMSEVFHQNKLLLKSFYPEKLKQSVVVPQQVDSPVI